MLQSAVQFSAAKRKSVMDDLFGQSTYNEHKSVVDASDKKKSVKFEDDEGDLPSNSDVSDEDSHNWMDKANEQELVQPIVNTQRLSHLFGIIGSDDADAPKNRNDQEVDVAAVKSMRSGADPLSAVVGASSREDSTLNKAAAVDLHTSLDDKLSRLSENPSSASNNRTGSANLAADQSRRAASGATMKSLFSNDSDDVIGNLADSATPKATAASSALQSRKSLMEDLFGRESSTSAAASKAKSTLASSSPSLVGTRIINTTESASAAAANYEMSSAGKSQSQNTGYSLSVPKEPRRGRRTSTTTTAIQNDPFGYLSASTSQFDQSPKEKPTTAAAAAAATAAVVVAGSLATKSTAPANEALPDWLGGTKSSRQPDKTPTLTSDNSTTPAVASSLPLSKEGANETSNLTSKLLGMEFNQQSAIMNMQQQEHELRTAAALSRQTDNLNYLLEMQKLKLTEQEKQFNALIAKQLERQTLIETQIKAQQDRIDAYIQSLAAQPTTTMPPSLLSSLPSLAKSTEAANDDKVESESLLHKAQLEKLYLENTLESLREKHAQETSMLEESYRKQIAHLEEALVQMEKRTQDDIEALEADYKLKVQKLKEDLADCEKARREEKAILMEENLLMIRDIQDRHRKNLDILQIEHAEIIDKLTKSKESERQAIEIMRSDGTNVQSLLNKSQLLMETLENLQNKFEKKDDHLSDLQSSHFSAQEKNIEYMKNLLESQKEALDQEKQRFMTTNQKLESSISELTKEFQKQNASLQMSEEILKSKEQALLRDREIFVEQMNWERERLKAMMDAWAKEEDKQLEWLAQERQALASERGKLQIFNRLKNQVDESSKIELEAAVQAAQEAAFSANQERAKWHEKIKELDRKEHILKEEEHLLVQKAKELQEFTQSAISKREEGLKALKEAHFIEQRYKEKFNQLHLQQEIFMEKESTLAAEKLELAKTRLSLHVSEIEKPEKDTDGNNKTSQEKQVANYSDVPTTTSECTTFFKDIVDPHLVILKWDLENNLGFSQTTF